jgi:hypothetical protein
MSDILQWTNAAPLWPALNGNGANPGNSSLQFGQPALLRFDKDEFMDEFLNVLENQPTHLGEYLAQPETWRDPLPAPAPVPAPPAFLRTVARRLGNPPPVSLPAPTTRPLKLFQPAHQRYYLVAACLVCRAVGFPDRMVDSGNAERATFVVRRLLPKDAVPPPARPDPTNLAQYDEYAWISQGSGGTWKKVENGKSRATGEEQHPFFAVNYPQADGRRRRMFAGLIPTGKREAYLTAKGETSPTGAAPTPDPRLKVLVERQFFAPLQQVRETNQRLVDKLVYDRAHTDDQPAVILAQTDLIKTTRQQIQETSWLLLSDLAGFINTQFPDLLRAFDPANPLPPSLPAEQEIVTVLESATLHPDTLIALTAEFPGATFAESLGDALFKIWTFQGNLDDNTQEYGSGAGSWPDFLFPLVDIAILVSATKTPAFRELVPTNFLDDLRDKINQALPTQASARLAPVPLVAQTPLKINDPGWFVIRCIFERPNCQPLPLPEVSDPTLPFQIAGFFDPEAPARPIRIALPVDTSPAGLRKFDKNTAFLISDMLCGQIDRAKGLGLGDLVRSILPWPLHKDLDVPDTGPCEEDNLSFGMICSLSIPIITICALILLMIIVTLLDIIFHWIPFFILCFRLPNFNAKEAAP